MYMEAKRTILIRASFMMALGLLGGCLGLGKREAAATDPKADPEIDQGEEDILPAPPLPVVIDTPASTPHHSSSNALSLGGSCVSGNTVHLSGAQVDEVSCSAGRFSFLLGAVGEGTRNYSLLQKDSHDQSSTSVSFQWTLDQTAPAAPTQLTPAANPHISSDNSVTLSGACETSAQVQISGDHSASLTCTNGSYSFNISKLVDDTYDFSVKQTDLAGNESSALSFAWTRDSAVPATPIITTPAISPHYSKIASLVIEGTCTNDLEVIVTGATNQSVVCSASTFSFPVTLSSETSYNYSVYQRSQSGIESGTASVQFVYDITAPSAVSLTSPPTNPYTSGPSFSAVGNCEDHAVVSFRVSAGAEIGNVVCSSNSFTFNHSEAIDDSYFYDFVQTDRAGNESLVLQLNWIRETPAPSPPVISSPNPNPHLSNGDSIVISGSCDDGNLVELTGDAADSATCSAGAFSFNVGKIADDVYNFEVTQNDGSKTSGAANVQWTRDTLAPLVTFSSTPADPSYSRNAEFQFSANESGVTFECRLDGGSFVSCSSPQNFSSLSLGAHTVDVRAIDAAGNMGANESFGWDIDPINAVALYHFDSGAELLDDGHYENDLVNSGSTASASGKFSDSRAFARASSQSMSLSYDAASFESTRLNMSIEAFGKLSSLPSNGQRYVIAANSTDSAACASNCSWIFGLKRQGSNYRLYVLYSTAGEAMTEVQSGNITFDTTNWYHMAFVWEGGQIRIYRDGTLLTTSGTVGSTPLFSSTADLRIGGDAAGNFFDGLIDEVRWSAVVRNGAAPTSAYSAD